MGTHVLAQTASTAAATPIEVPGKAFKEGHVEAGGFRLHYKEAGPKNAPVLISLPGSAGLEMSRAKDILIREYRIIELNPPGWGDDAELTREMNQDEIGKILGEAANKLTSGKYHVLGTSMGGGNALWLAVQYPERVKSIVLEGSMAPTRPADLGMPMIYRADIRKRQESGTSAPPPAGPPPGPPPAGGAGQYPTPATDPAKPWATPEYMSKQMAVRFRLFKWVQTDVGTPELLAKVRAMNIPILGLVGDKDGIIKPGVGSYYHEVLPTAKFVLIPGGAHDLQNSQTDSFVREVRKFLAQSQ
jgi:pimeloyl-ACP methyl ester carboxylesterase